MRLRNAVRFSVAAVVLLCVPSSSGAQMFVFAGPNYGTFEFQGSGAQPQDNLQYRVGVDIQYPLHDVYGMLVHATLSRHVRDGSRIFRDNETRFEQEFLILATGFNLRHELPSRDRLEPYLRFGPELGFLLQAIERPGIAGRESRQITGETHGLSFSVGLGGGTEFRVSRVLARFEVGYMLGFNDLLDHPDRELRVRSAYATLGIGWGEPQKVGVVEE